MDIGFAIAIAVKSAIGTVVYDARESLLRHIRQAGDRARSAKGWGRSAKNSTNPTHDVRTIDGEVLKKTVNPRNIAKK